MIPKIVSFEEKKLVGKRITMSFAENKTSELWKSFMPIKNEIPNIIDSDLYSVQFYKDDFFRNFNPNNSFDKWAAVEVSSFDGIPNSFETFTINGLYAIFDYKGNPNQAETVFQYIFSEWLPKSGYELDNRKHFEILGRNYKNNNPDSEELICIPIQLK